MTNVYNSSFVYLSPSIEIDAFYKTGFPVFIVVMEEGTVTTFYGTEAEREGTTLPLTTGFVEYHQPVVGVGVSVNIVGTMEITTDEFYPIR